MSASPASSNDLSPSVSAGSSEGPSGIGPFWIQNVTENFDDVETFVDVDRVRLDGVPVRVLVAMFGKAGLVMLKPAFVPSRIFSEGLHDCGSSVHARARRGV
jgi:hypothetical protein